MSDIQLVLSDSLKSFSLIDSLATFAPGAPAFTDSLTLTEALTLIEAGFIDIPLEGVALSDSEIVALGRLVETADSLTLDDTLTNLVAGIERAVSDAIVLSDSTNFEGSGISLGLTDALALTDGNIVVTGVVASFTENLTLSDTIDPFAPDSLGFTDILSISDAITVDPGTGEIAIAMTNTLTFSDSAIVVEGLTVGKSDVVSLTDAESGFAGGFLAKSDTLSFSDFLRLNAPIEGFEVSDSLLFTELLTLKYSQLWSFDDTLSLSDSITIDRTDVAPSVSDSYTLSDFVSLSLSTANITKSDTLAWSDNAVVVRNANLLVSVNDTLVLVDTLSTTVYSDFIDYLRRYLNDAPGVSNNG